MTETATTCAHEACRCSRPYSAQNLAMSTRRTDPDAEFCSRRCEEQARDERQATGCECGHPECMPQATQDIPPMQ